MAKKCPHMSNSEHTFADKGFVTSSREFFSDCLGEECMAYSKGKCLMFHLEDIEEDDWRKNG